MQVVHAISTLEPQAGGPPAALVGLVSAQQDVGLRVRVLATFTANADFRLAEQLRDKGVKVDMVGPVRTPLGLHPKLEATVRRAVTDSDVVHIHALWEQIQHVAARTARRQGKPYIIRPCGMLAPWSLRQSRLKKRIYYELRLRRNLNAAAAIHFTTESERSLTDPLKLLAPSIVEPNGIDLAEFDSLPASGQFRKLYPHVGDKPIIAFMGRIHPGKGVELLIPAMARLKSPDAMLVIIGPDSGGYARVMQQLADEHGVADRVVFTGMLRGPDRLAALVDADLFAMPSEHENFGIAIIEAMACGTPVIVSEDVAIAGEIEKAKVGAVVDLEVATIERELRGWLDAPVRRQQASGSAQRLVRQQFAWEQIARRWKAHYASVTHCCGS